MAPVTDRSPAEEFARRNHHVMGDAAAEWTPDQTMAWVGLLGTHRALSRGFSKAVEEQTGMSPTALGLLGRLSEEPESRLRISALSDDIGLSLSRTSRVVDALEHHGLVARTPCPSDARATNVVLSDAGRKMLRDAQAASSAWVHEHFFAHLTDAELASLASIFERFAVTGPGLECDATASAGAEPCDSSAAPCP